MERFLIRAEKLVNLSDLYVHPENNGDKAKFRVTYGIYPNRDQAAVAITELPENIRARFTLSPLLSAICAKRNHLKKSIAQGLTPGSKVKHKSLTGYATFSGQGG